MTFPVDWTLVNVFGTYLNNDGTGTPCSGVITFRSLQTVVIDSVEVVPAFIKVSLDASGHFSINLPSTNDPDLSATGWGYQATFNFTGNEPDPFWFVVPWTSAPIDLTSVLPVVLPSVVPVPSGPPGPSCPTSVADGAVFVVPLNTQILFTAPIELIGAGTIEVDGLLVEVA